MTESTVGIVVIGRNEGARLTRCLASVMGRGLAVVYVDSGSADGSPDRARAAGARVIELDPAHPFTAARARNAGLAALLAAGPLAYVQFVDGDCEILDGWIGAARATLDAEPGLAAVAGRLSERNPGASVYTRLCDMEWDRPPGLTDAIGGIAMMRVAAIGVAGGFDNTLISGEEPELCRRLHVAGWRIRQIAAPMALHDAAMTRFGQWWQRTRRGGHAAAEAMARGDDAGTRQALRALGWGAGLPLATLAGMGLAGPWALLLLLAWPGEIARLARQRGLLWAAFTVLGRLAETHGMLGCWTAHLGQRPARLIEYKARTAPRAHAGEPFLSVVIPTCLRPDRLQTTLRAVLAQCTRQDPAEVIVVDNDPDGSASAVTPRGVRYVHEPRRGVAHARNRGVEAARGSHVVFLDDDEIPGPGWLDAFRARARAGDLACFGRIEAEFEEAPPAHLAGVLGALFSRRLDRATGADISDARAWLGTGNAMFHKAACLAGAAPFDPRFNGGGEDTWLIRTLVEDEGIPLTWSNDAMVREIVPPGRMTPAYLKARKFEGGVMRCIAARGQGGATALARVGVWMGAGLVQSFLYGVAEACLRLAGRASADAMAARAAGGLGKLMWWADPRA